MTFKTLSFQILYSFSLFSIQSFFVVLGYSQSYMRRFIVKTNWIRCEKPTGKRYYGLTYTTNILLAMKIHILVKQVMRVCHLNNYRIMLSGTQQNALSPLPLNPLPHPISTCDKNWANWSSLISLAFSFLWALILSFFRSQFYLF